MLITARYVLDRLRQPRSRADEVRDLRRRLVEEPRRGSADEMRLAGELRTRRKVLFAALGNLESCRTCARAQPAPEGHWDGGYCCSGHTIDLFSSDETAALRQGGTRPGHLSGPRSDHAGCAFRGPRGCSLDVAHRPNLCVHYLCTATVRELHDRGDLTAIESLREQLWDVFADFKAARNQRLVDEMIPICEPLPESIAESAHPGNKRGSHS